MVPLLPREPGVVVVGWASDTLSQRRPRIGAGGGAQEVTGLEVSSGFRPA